MRSQIQFNGGIPMKWVAAVTVSILVACRAETGNGAPEGKNVAPGVQRLGRIENTRVTESSGVVVSRTHPNIFWTHNDGGGKRQVLYAMSRTGRSLAEFRITGALLNDWEDIATDDKGNLYLADTGNNEARRQNIAVHEVPEPDLKESKNGIARVTRAWNLHYPNRPFDAESLFILGDSGYIISKVTGNERADIYRFSLTNDSTAQTLSSVAEVNVDSPVTGADVSADGNLLALVAKNGAYVFRIKGDVSRASKGKPFQVKFKHDQIEGCTFVPEGLLATAESRDIYLFTDEAFRTGPVKKK
jgi:hypothetical protein